MDDFRASAPEQRGPVNPNVESIPFEDMKERILKIVKGYNGWVLGKSSCLWLSLRPRACTAAQNNPLDGESQLSASAS